MDALVLFVLFAELRIMEPDPEGMMTVRLSDVAEMPLISLYLFVKNCNFFLKSSIRT